MKKNSIILLIILGLIAIGLVSIYYHLSKPVEAGGSPNTCAELNETCGGGIQGPNGESSYINCCTGLICNHTYKGGYSELGVCVS